MKWDFINNRKDLVMADSAYLQRMRYFQGEFLDATDFSLEQTYFRKQFGTLYFFCFSPGLAGLAQSEVPPMEYRLQRELVTSTNDAELIQPVSFYLKIVSTGKTDEAQADNVIKVGPGLGIDPSGGQITLLSEVSVDKNLFASITGAQAYLLIACGSDVVLGTGAKTVSQSVTFSAVETTDYNADATNALYLATVTLKDHSIAAVSIDPKLRQYARPYSDSQMVLSKTTSLSNALESQVATLKARIEKLEAALASRAPESGTSGRDGNSY